MALTTQMRKDGEIDLGRPPRRAQATLLAQILRGFMVALLIGAPILFVFVGKRERAKLEKLAAEGQQVEARITGRSSRKSTHTLRYEFVVDGKSYSGSKDVASSEYSYRQVGSIVPVTYLPADPQVNAYGKVRPEDAGAAETKNWLMATVCGAILLLGVIAIERLIRWERRLCERGVAVQGQVTGQSRGKNAKTHYAYTTEAGAEHGGSAQATFRTRKLAIGDPLTVLYDPERKQKSKPYACMAMARIVGKRGPIT